MAVLGILIGLVVIGLIMFFHEGGHFLAGRLLNFKILEFSIFMGPRLLSTEKKGIKYSFKLLPIGASVRFAGEHNEDDEENKVNYDNDDPGLFFNRPRWARALVVFSGPLANFVTAFLAFIIMFVSFGVVLPKLEAPPVDSLAYEVGLEAGDKILEVNNEKIHTLIDFSMATEFVDPQEQKVFLIEKESGAQKRVVLTPRTEDNYRLGIQHQINPDGTGIILNVDPRSNQGSPVLLKDDIILTINNIAFEEALSQGISQEESESLNLSVKRGEEVISVSMVTTLFTDQVNEGLYLTDSKSFNNVINQAVLYPWSIIKSTVKGFGMIFAGEMKFSEGVTGPIGIVKMLSDTVSENTDIKLIVYQLLFYFAIISVALGFTNLLPIPPLDGHHLLILGVEGVRGKNLSKKFKQAVASVGMFLILMLALFVIYVDIKRFF